VYYFYVKNVYVKLTNTKGPSGEVMISSWCGVASPELFHRVDVHLDDVLYEGCYLGCFCSYTVLDSARAQTSVGQAKGCVPQEDDILRTLCRTELLMCRGLVLITAAAQLVIVPPAPSPPPPPTSYHPTRFPMKSALIRHACCCLLSTRSRSIWSSVLIHGARSNHRSPKTCAKKTRTTLRYWLQYNLKMEWAFKPESQGRMPHR
jgi:hypothetical protein